MLVLAITQMPACGGGGGGGGGVVGGGGKTVSATNTPPVISGSPAGTAPANTEYVFKPTAMDADGDKLSFSISKKPLWASFNTGTGQLRGTPADTDAGTYSNIVISVRDNTKTTSLAPFNITVTTNAPNRTAVLTWVAPVTNADGTALVLNEIAGYRVYSGTVSTNLSLTADIPDSSTTTYTAKGLPSGINYFAVTAYDFSDNESQRSNTSTKTFP